MTKDKPSRSKQARLANKGLHLNNLHKGGYDLFALATNHPPLKAHVIINAYGNRSIDFANPDAVMALNCALLKTHYRINRWSIPNGSLCPPVPGRVDYIHYISDLIASNAKKSAETRKIRLLDIGTGASGIYSILACNVYAWECVASDIDPASLDNVQRIINDNPSLIGKIQPRLQKNARQIFKGVIRTGEKFDVSICNPPFHASLEEALKSNKTKLTKLSANRAKNKRPLGYNDKTTVIQNPTSPHSLKSSLNFGGQNAELYCTGGELNFVRLMIKESHLFADQCHWFTTLISKSDNLKPAKKLLRKLDARDIQAIEMKQGNKITRILAWTFSQNR